MIEQITSFKKLRNAHKIYSVDLFIFYLFEDLLKHYSLITSKIFGFLMFYSLYFLFFFEDIAVTFNQIVIIFEPSTIRSFPFGYLDFRRPDNFLLSIDSFMLFRRRCWTLYFCFYFVLLLLLYLLVCRRTIFLDFLSKLLNFRFEAFGGSGYFFEIRLFPVL